MLAMIITVDEPRPMYYGGVVAAPVFKEVMNASLRYMGYVPREIPDPKPAKAGQAVKTLALAQAPNTAPPIQVAAGR
jgi:hypothetical protein